MQIINNDEPYDPGDSITIEQEVKETSPFSDTENYIDADSVKITIKDPDGNVEEDSVSMTKEETGKYYYKWHTAQSYDNGDYEVKIIAKKGESQGLLDDSYIRLE